MSPFIRRLLMVGAVAVLALPAAAHAAPVQNLNLERIGGTEPAGNAGAEIAAYDHRSKRLFVTNRLDVSPSDQIPAANRLDIFDLSPAPGTPDFGKLITSIDLTPYGAGANSVAVSPKGRPLVAVAIEADPKTADGTIEVFDTEGTHLKTFPAGALPDMVTFTKDGRHILSANEGEPNSYGLPDSVDPEGSVTIVDLPGRERRHGGHRRGHASHHGGGANLDRARATTVRFDRFTAADLIAKGVRIYGPGASAAQDLEPEYIATDHEGEKAWVTLQENNALAIVDIERKKVKEVKSLGFKDYSLAANELDPSDRDPNSAARRNLTQRKADDLATAFPNLLGMYQPDAIAAYELGGRQRLVTANEGDVRADWPGFTEDKRVSDVVASPGVDLASFPAGTLTADNLGRLKVTQTLGNTDADPQLEKLYTYGARSLSIWDGKGDLRYDTGSDLETFLSTFAGGAFFNLDGTTPGGRSDDKGPEPEGVAVGRVGGRGYAFLGLERSGGIAAYDLGATPDQALRAGYVNTSVNSGALRDVSPEGVLHIPARRSPTGTDLVLATHEVSGNVAIYQATPAP